MVTGSDSRAAIRRLVALLGEAYDQKAWHGPNLKGLLRGVTAKQAAFRLHPNRHNIWELVVHCAYWKYAVARLLTGERRGRFTLPGSNWFRRPIEESAAAWRLDRQVLDQHHANLLNAIAKLTDADLDRKPRGSKHAIARLIAGAGAHDLYHAGQIAMIKRSLAAR